MEVSKTPKFSVFSLPPASGCPSIEDSEDCLDSHFESVFEDLNDINRWKSSTSDQNLVYGEIIGMDSMRTILKHIRENGGLRKGKESFCDLGSGTGSECVSTFKNCVSIICIRIGKAVVAAALLHDFSECYGIEIVSKLHNASETAKSRYDDLCWGNPEIIFREGSFLDLSVLDWTIMDVVYANSTCFTTATMAEISILAARMKPGSFFVSLTYALDKCAGFSVIGEERMAVSWGSADFIIQLKDGL